MLGASAVPGGVHAPLHGVRLLSESFLAEESERRWRTTEEQMAGALLIKIQKAAVKIIITKNTHSFFRKCVVGLIRLAIIDHYFCGKNGEEDKRKRKKVGTACPRKKKSIK